MCEIGKKANLYIGRLWLTKIKIFYSDICCAAKPRCFRATVTIGDKRLIENGAS